MLGSVAFCRMTSRWQVIFFRYCKTRRVLCTHITWPRFLSCRVESCWVVASHSRGASRSIVYPCVVALLSLYCTCFARYVLLCALNSPTLFQTTKNCSCLAPHRSVVSPSVYRCATTRQHSLENGLIYSMAVCFPSSEKDSIIKGRLPTFT